MPLARTAGRLSMSFSRVWPLDIWLSSAGMQWWTWTINNTLFITSKVWCGTFMWPPHTQFTKTIQKKGCRPAATFSSSCNARRFTEHQHKRFLSRLSLKVMLRKPLDNHNLFTPYRNCCSWRPFRGNSFHFSSCNTNFTAFVHVHLYFYIHILLQQCWAIIP